LDICAELKENLKNTEENLGSTTKHADKCKTRVEELEENVRELSAQLEKWILFTTIKPSNNSSIPESPMAES